MIDTHANNKDQTSNFLNLLEATFICFSLNGNHFLLIYLNKLCLFVFSKLAKASSLDNGKIVAAKKDIRRRER